jgi:flagellar motor switch protein FliN/FliY
MAAQLTTEALWRALAGEFRAVVEAVVGRVLTANAVPPPSGSGWRTPIAASGLVDGQITVWVDEAGVTAVARAMMGMDGTPDPTVAADMLKELWAQATAAIARQDWCDGQALVPGPPMPGTLPAQGEALAITDGATTLATLLMTGTVAVGHGGAEYSGNLAALLDIDLPLIVRFARTEMALRALAQLGPGSMMDMGRSPDAPVQLLIGNQVVAEGEVVVVAGNYGVRITSLVSPADRLRAMEQ